MRRSLSVSLLVLLSTAAACYHATVNTGLTPSAVVVEEGWAPGWLWGLVPPGPIETAAKCPHGVAKVETQHSFLNLLVGGLTGGIFQPMSIKATCAQAGRASLSPTAPTVELGANATPHQIQDGIKRAAALSLRTGQPVYVEY